MFKVKGFLIFMQYNEISFYWTACVPVVFPSRGQVQTLSGTCHSISGLAAAEGPAVPSLAHPYSYLLQLFFPNCLKINMYVYRER